MSEKKLDLGSWVNDGVQYLLDNYSNGFDSIGGVVSSFSEGIEAILMLQAVAVRGETEAQARAGWRALSPEQKQQTLRAFQAMCGGKP